jgi:membrane associated rhomboid family serine protease
VRSAESRLVLGLALACALPACLPEGASALLAWDRAGLGNGQLWRLWSAHLVHFSVQQALCDGIVLCACAAIVAPALGSMRVLRQLLLAACLISLALLALPQLSQYRGASSLATLLAVRAGLLLWTDAARWRALLLAAALAWAGVTLAQACGVAVSAAGLPPDVAVAWQAHLLGAACALLPGWRSDQASAYLTSPTESGRSSPGRLS